MPLNTRAHKREPIKAPVEYAIHPSQEKSIKINIPHGSPQSATGKTAYIPAGLVDISVSGCGIESPYLIPPGVILDIKIDAVAFTVETKDERKDPVIAVGKVTSCVMSGSGKYRLGIFFTTINAKDVAFIDIFIALKERRNAPRWNMNQ